MKIYSWNVNGIRAVEKKGFLTWLEQTQPDVLCIQETKAWQAQLSYDLLEGHGYHTSWHSAQKKGYSSVATFCREKPLAVHHGLGIDKFDSEGRVLITEHAGFVLYNCYFPNGQHDLGRVPYKLDFYRALLAQVNARVAAGENVVIGGDWNTAHTPLDIKNAKANEGNTGFLPEERAMIDHYLAEGYVDAFRSLHPDVRDGYTWWSFRSGARERNIGWRIDYFMVNAALMPRVRAAAIHPEVTGSDHCPISLEIALA